ncbi:MAG: cysteate synthase [Bacteroidetes bacterium GWE2_39_28]|nr:MAG: cysteate synthase [Bacteroidetes bacterium GWE2_39_28]OFY15316.1 MAG: cysteate synthase [Bacteroidetes bacterium GWF2_39_10]OFZ07468.1 MAG: cysteate synthase [Bacteroidetes bacterium RIFOXYB2_FULL_39_7]OFZ11163.1 MAG: cysteate synthase [Bacteroidetes bacterium RIFOXYC2_FULL_39_11]HCT93953.1 cysteate synthase [Rikenellaceae bacterium]
MTNYKLRNYADGNLFNDTGWLLSDPSYNKPSLIRAIYEKKQLDVGDNSLGIYKFSDWLPINRTLEGSSATVTYKSKKLASKLGLGNLLISFSGYWPEIGANMTTCSFKETEAYSVCARLEQNHPGVMVVASAGNTARAFAKVCSENNIPLLLVVPEDNLDALWFNKMPSDCVKLICTPKGSDYFDAIDLSNKICKSALFFEEGGARNVARRDGMATTVLSAAAFSGQIPDYYFQAIGSGTGTIAAWEANLRLIEDGRFGNRKMVLLPSQNEPFTPMYDAWMAGSRDITYINEDDARENALKIAAKVLSNRRPPYGVPGGLFDAISDTGGSIEKATNSEMESSLSLFEECEGIDIHPAAGVALAGMIKSLESGKALKDSLLMLNITGGGEKRFKNDFNLVSLKPHKVLSNHSELSEIVKEAEILFD